MSSELEKWAAVAQQFSVTLRAIEFLEEQGEIECQVGTKAMLYRFFGIDTAQLEAERRDLLESARKGLGQP